MHCYELLCCWLKCSLHPLYPRPCTGYRPSNAVWKLFILGAQSRFFICMSTFLQCLENDVTFSQPSFSYTGVFRFSSQSIFLLATLTAKLPNEFLYFSNKKKCSKLSVICKTASKYIQIFPYWILICTSQFL